MLNRSTTPTATRSRCAIASNYCLIVTNNFPPTVGGAGEVYAALAAAAGGRIRILCARRSYLTGAEVAGWRDHDAAVPYPIDRITHVRPPLRRHRRRLASLVVEELPIRVGLLARVAWLRWRHGCRVVCIADDETVGWLIRPARWLLRCRVMLYSHGDDLAERPAEERLRARRGRQFGWADGIVAVSEVAARELGRVFGVPRERVTVIRNGIDLAMFGRRAADDGLRRPLGLLGSRVITTIARLVPRKGIDRVIEAMPAMLGVVPELEYLVVGEGPQEAELRALAARLGVAERVHFAGGVQHVDVPRYLALAELMVMPNRRMPDGEDDGLSLIFLEANACGLPVIAGRAGGAPEAVADGDNGLLVDGADVQAIGAAITRVLGDGELAARLARNGLRRAGGAGWERATAEFLTLCERLAG